jgi:hypothetical protein
MAKKADDAFRDEAERLALLPRKVQLQVIGLHRETAANRKAPQRERKFALDRADALERHLRRLNRRKKA